MLFIVLLGFNVVFKFIKLSFSGIIVLIQIIKTVEVLLIYVILYRTLSILKKHFVLKLRSDPEKLNLLHLLNIILVVFIISIVFLYILKIW
jgi:hypothetical protein